MTIKTLRKISMVFCVLAIVTGSVNQFLPISLWLQGLNLGFVILSSALLGAQWVRMYVD